MNLKQFVSKAKSRYKNGGLRVLFSHGVRYARNGFKKPGYQTTERVDTTERLEAIRSHIDTKDQNLLDIGCADGVLTAKLASNGIFCIGIERDETNLKMAHKRFENRTGLGYMKHNTTPRNICELPNFDVILLLTVFEWWCRDYGIEQAEAMLQEIYSKSNKLFFEGHGDSISHGGPQRNDGIKEYYSTYFTEVLNEPEIKYIGMTDYKGGTRKDPLFVLS